MGLVENDNIQAIDGQETSRFRFSYIYSMVDLNVWSCCDVRPIILSQSIQGICTSSNGISSNDIPSKLYKTHFSSLSDETKKFHRDRYRDFFSRPKFSRQRPRLFFETKYFRDRYRDFFSRPNVFETDTETFLRPNFFETDTETFAKVKK